MLPLYLAPVSFSNKELIKRISSYLIKNYRWDVQIVAIPVDAEKCFSAERNQYYSTKLIAETIPLTSSFEGKVQLLVEFDLYVPVFTYVFGEAQLLGKHSIVSVCRLHEEFYTGLTDEKLLFERSIKEVLHELGHNFGLHHCKNWDCVMHPSPGIEEVDIKGADFCTTCANQIIF